MNDEYVLNNYLFTEEGIYNLMELRAVTREKNRPGLMFFFKQQAQPLYVACDTGNVLSLIEEALSEDENNSNGIQGFN